MFMPFEMPEEMREQLRKQAEEHAMQTENYYHSVQHLFDELNKEQLLTLRWILHNVRADESGQLASYYEGQLANMLHQKHNVCPGCGKDHAEEFLDNPASGVSTESVNANTERVKAETTADIAHFGPSALTDEQRGNMDEYNIDDAWDEETGKFLGFVCLGCGLKYQSIEDRMLKPPGVEGCSGCIQKAKFG